MTCITKLFTALPDWCVDNDQVSEVARIWLKDCPEKFELFERFLKSAHTSKRYFSMPHTEVIKERTLQEREILFEQLAPTLATKALKGALEQSGTKPEELDALIFTSCSFPIIPAVDTHLVANLNLRQDIVRVPAYQYGCAGGVSGLGLAHRLSPSLKRIAVVSAELCSLVFQPSNTETSQLVGAALFGDGAAASIISNQAEHGLEIIDHQSFLLPNSRHLMGYDARDTGFHLRLDRLLPSAVAENFPEILNNFLSKHLLVKEKISHWLFHPGSSKILDYLDEVCELENEQSKWSRIVLNKVGNLSSATILFVLNEFLTQGSPHRKDLVMIAGIGPGLTVELILGTIT